ncbi:MAG: Gfo/Idh/MocA family oxidoreductase [Desulfobacterales bacterium]
MAKLRVGVVGVGYLGKFHAEKYAGMPDVHLVGVVDTDLQRARQLAERLGTQAFGSHRELLDKVDAASIVVPTAEHHAVSLDFLRHNVDLLIEKPMTSTLRQADELIAYAAAHGLLIQVGHLERFNSAVAALENIVTAPMFIESHRLTTFKGRGTDVSVVLDLMIHDIDIISTFVRSEIRGIRAAGIAVISPEVDIANARLEFENGCVANVTASRISMKNERKIRLFQRDAYVSVDFSNHGITVIRKTGEHPEGIIPGMEIQNLCFTKGDALEDELKSFVRAVKRREEPEVTAEMGRDALRIALDIMEQIQSTSSRYFK